MAQSKIESLIETLTNTAVGFVFALVAQHYVMPWYGFHPSASQNVQMTLIFTIISIIRGYAIRRWFNGNIGAATVRAVKYVFNSIVLRKTAN